MLDDVELFLRLNQEYAAKPLSPAPSPSAEGGSAQAQELEKRHRVRGKRVLDVGCGFGETARALASELGCDVVAVDANPSYRDQWAQVDSAGVDFRVFDVTRDDLSVLGGFHFIRINGTLEHVVHPFALLSSLVGLMPMGGRMHFDIALQRGASGSHLHDDVLFPWPHLVFTESTFERFYERVGKAPRRPVRTNHITAAQWLEMFDVLGLHAETVSYSQRAIDRSFYERFEEILGRYPTYDLERDQLHVDLVRPEDNRLIELTEPPNPVVGTLKRRRFEALRAEVERIEKIATDRLQSMRTQQVEQSMLAVAVDLEQKVARLQQFEERLVKDLHGMRHLGRAMSIPGMVLDVVRAAIANPKPGAESSRS